MVERLAAELSFAGRPVRDRTGLNGSFDVFLAKATMTAYLDKLDLLLESREVTRWQIAG